MKYRLDEVLDLLDNVNCLEDMQVLVATIWEYPQMFPTGFYSKYERLMLIYVDLFINEI